MPLRYRKMVSIVISDSTKDDWDYLVKETGLPRGRIVDYLVKEEAKRIRQQKQQEQTLL